MQEFKILPRLNFSVSLSSSSQYNKILKSGHIEFPLLPWSFIVFIFTETGDYFIEFLSIFPQIHVVHFSHKFNGNDAVNLGMHNIRRYIS